MSWEVAMTVVVGVMCVIGISTSVRFRSSLSIVSRAAMFVVLAGIQFARLRMSVLPAIARR